MRVSVDNCTSIMPNCSNNTVMHTAYDNFACFIGFYINIMVICTISLPLNIWALWLIWKTTTTRKGSASSHLLHINVIFASVMFCITFVISTLSSCNMSSTFCAITVYIFSISLIGQAQFRTWICAENYVAVVHPIFYLKLKQTWYRMVWVSFTWVTSSIFGALAVFLPANIGIFLYIILFCGLVVLILFCSLATLATLKKPNPGEGERRKMHHQKIKAVRIITSTLVMLITTYFPYICLITFSSKLRPEILCIFKILMVFLLSGTVFQSLLYISRFFKT